MAKHKENDLMSYDDDRTRKCWKCFEDKKISEEFRGKNKVCNSCLELLMQT